MKIFSKKYKESTKCKKEAIDSCVDDFFEKLDSDVRNLEKNNFFEKSNCTCEQGIVDSQINDSEKMFFKKIKVIEGHIFVSLEGTKYEGVFSKFVKRLQLEKRKIKTFSDKLNRKIKYVEYYYKNMRKSNAVYEVRFMGLFDKVIHITDDIDKVDELHNKNEFVYSGYYVDKEYFFSKKSFDNKKDK